jgi:ketosteroid isomerase-like protein
MSQERVESVHQFVLEAFDAWNRREFDEAARLAHEDFEFHLIGGFADMVGEEFKGREGLFRFWRDLAGTVGGKAEVERTAEMDEGRLLVIGTLKGFGMESGAPSSFRFGQVWTFSDGKVIRVDSYYDPRDALEAAGLSE